MKDITKLEQAVSCIEKLTQGIDPTNDTALDKNSIVCHEEIAPCLKLALAALERELDELRSQGENDKKLGRKAFFITEAQLRKLSLNNGECKVSDIAKEINRVTEGNATNTMQAVWINNWLESVGLLYRNSDGNRVATEEGQGIGIKSVLEHTANVPDNYTNYYSLHAQTYIYDHLRDILAHHFGE
ncbi:MAG: hypothetical protein IJ779_10080 [Ruminococcus sp.]|nr:hypothetical protein [Ruminococcus sp.]